MKKLEVSSFGPISDGAVEFGDLTILVGPQASGKSLLVQLFKAIADAGSIRNTLKEYGFEWLHSRNPLRSYLNLYFGEGMGSIWGSSTRILVDGKRLDFEHSVVRPPSAMGTDQSVFLIPAQRVLVLEDGWPSPTFSRSTEVPYCTRVFSDGLRGFLGIEAASSKGPLFPRPRLLKAELRRQVDEGIYVGAKLRLERRGMRQRLVLEPPGGGSSLPYSVWSAGQREFTPLLLGLYSLMPPTKITKREHIQSVVIEEPEMGLHPQAIMSFCLLVFELLHRGYRVVVSTHSPVVLDVVWALRDLQTLDEPSAIQALAKIFHIKLLSPPLKEMLGCALKKSYRTFYFKQVGRKGVRILDISTLDPGATDDADISGWGGLSGFSGHTAQVVGEALSNIEDR